MGSFAKGGISDFECAEGILPGWPHACCRCVIVEIEIPTDPMCLVKTQGCPHAAKIGPLSLPRPVI